MSFGLAPNQLPQADLQASNKSPVYVAVAVGFVLATGGVVLRCLARRKSQATFGWDDYTIIFALILLYGLDIASILSAAKYGLGQHLPAVISTAVSFQKVSIANITLWLATAAATKASLLLLYYRLFSPSKCFRLSVRIGAAVVFCQWFSLTCLTIFECIPIAAFWDRAIQNAKCMDLARVTLASGVLNLLTDVLILCLPIPMVWGLNTTKAQKVTLTGIFLLGVFVCAISIVRISKISELAAVNYDDVTWGLVDVYFWTTLEVSVGITSACLPTLRPLFGRSFASALRAESSKQKDSGTSFHRTAKAQFTRLFEEPMPEAAAPGVTKGGEDVWTSPDLASGNELHTMNKAPARPLHTVNSAIRREDRHHLVSSTRRASYE